MYIQLIDNHNFKSPALYIHCDKDEFLKVIDKWKKDTFEFVRKERSSHPRGGFPLTMFDPEVCIVDLMRVLTAYYEMTAIHHEGRIIGTLRLVNESTLSATENIAKVNLEEEYATFCKTFDDACLN